MTEAYELAKVKANCKEHWYLPLFSSALTIWYVVIS